MGLSAPISRLLTAGMAASLTLMVAGGLLALLRRAEVRAVPVEELPAGLAGLDPSSLMSLGILALIATPAARVAALLVGYLRLRQWRFAALSAFVLAVLAAGLTLGAGAP